MKNKYRIIQNEEDEYILEGKYWYWPFWIELCSAYNLNAIKKINVSDTAEFAKINNTVKSQL